MRFQLHIASTVCFIRIVMMTAMINDSRYNPPKTWYCKPLEPAMKNKAVNRMNSANSTYAQVVEER